MPQPLFNPNVRLGPQTLDEKLMAVKQKFPLAQFPPDFGTHPADATALDRMASPLPAWAQKAGASVSEFFGAGKPKTNEMMSRVGSMKGAGGRSISDSQYSGLLRAGRLMTDNLLPTGQAGSSVARTVERAQQLYNKEVPILNMSARGALSAKSMLSDVMEMSGYAPNPRGGYVQTRDIDRDTIGAIYAEAAGRGLNPTEVAIEKMATAVALENPDVQARVSQDRPVPLWQNDSGNVVTSRDIEEGPNAAAKVMRYVPKFMETSQNQA